MSSSEEHEIKQWISNILGEDFTGRELYEILRDGVVLCNMINKITGAKSVYPRHGKANFVQMENINYFIESARKLNVPDSENFSTPDLFENKDFRQVIICLYSLSRNLYKNGRTDLPVIGPTLVKTTNTFEFTEEQLSEAKRTISPEYGYTPASKNRLTK